MGGITDIATAAFPVAGIANGLGVGGVGGSSGGKGGGGPSAPDFAAMAKAQADSSRDATNAQTTANRPGQTNAFGASTSWTTGPDGRPVQTQTLGGPLGGAASSLEQQAATNAGTPLDNGSAVRQKAIDATYDQAKSRLDPQWQQNDEGFRSQMAAQGLDPGSQAFDSAKGNLDRAKTDAYGSAMRGAISNGNEAQALTFGENVAARQEPMNELGQLRGFTEMPQFSQAGAAQPTQYLPAAGMAYQGALQNQATQQAGKNSKMGGGATLGAGAMMASDERLKVAIERLDTEAIPGVPFATWEWRGSSGHRSFGVIAQDVERVRPDLVTMRDGVRMVDYAGLLGVNHG